MRFSPAQAHIPRAIGLPGNLSKNDPSINRSDNILPPPLWTRIVEIFPCGCHHNQTRKYMKWWCYISEKRTPLTMSGSGNYRRWAQHANFVVAADRQVLMSLISMRENSQSENRDETLAYISGRQLDMMVVRGISCISDPADVIRLSKNPIA